MLRPKNCADAATAHDKRMNPSKRLTCRRILLAEFVL